MNFNAKLTAQNVLDIRARHGQTQQDIADEFGVSQVLIGMVRRREIWRHV